MLQGCPGPKTGCFSHPWQLLCLTKSAPKKLKSNFSQRYVLFFKGSWTLLHCSHILSNLKSCLIWYCCSFYVHKLTLMQAKHQLTNVCILCRSQAAFMIAWSHSWSHFFILPLPKKNFCFTPWCLCQQFLSSHS